MRTVLHGYWRDERHGPLPALLLVLTLVTGLVDAVSYLALGHVFVANMTGNVVFLGFALAGATELSIPAAPVAITAFLLGALAGGRLGSSAAHHRGRLLAISSKIQIALLGAAVIVSAAPLAVDGGVARYALIVLLALAIGLQNAVKRRRAAAWRCRPEHDGVDTDADRNRGRLDVGGWQPSESRTPLGRNRDDVPRRGNRRGSPLSRRRRCPSRAGLAAARV